MFALNNLKKKKELMEDKEDTTQKSTVILPSLR